MTEQELFDQIDSSIESFRRKEGLHKGIKVFTRPHSDWLIFKWRQLTWKENDIKYLIEVYPSFDTQDNITGWNLCAAAYYDQDKKRYYTTKNIAENTSLDFIANNSHSPLLEGYQFLSNIKKEQIPFAVVLE